ncbi:hypothetical protein F5Y17DRAFT_450459 [Xylariaceae sp. FL0594]|nr:hypothetical protein F5Y17DRAFT_450459 [Xylariaceae sp. FL0594]
MSTRSIQSHQIVRVAAVAINIVTARHLFANGFHYPLLMLIAHTSGALLIEILSTWLGSRDEPTGPNSPQRHSSHGSTTRIVWQSLYAATTAAGLVFAYHSFLHNRNTTLVVMILALDFSTIFNRVGKWLRQDRPRSIDILLSIATFLICVVLLVTWENWLVGKGIEYVLFGVAFASIARCLRRSGRAEASFVANGNLDIDVHAVALAVCLPLALFLLLVTSWYNRRDFHVRGRIIGISISMISGAMSLLSETSLKRLVDPTQETGSSESCLKINFGGPTFSALILTVVELDNLIAQHRPSTTAVIQWAAFGVAYLSTMELGSEASPTLAPEESSYIHIPSFKFHGTASGEVKNPIPEDTEAFYPLEQSGASEMRWIRYLSLARHVVLASMALLLVFSCAVGRSREEQNERFWDLDIVIARYDEPIDQIVETTQLALDLTNVAGRKVRTIVYNKGMLNETELQAKFPAQSHLVVRELENVGREADTYLAHALDSEQDWASHTLFLQAEPHTPSYLQARLRDYLVEETGFLSLSHVRNFCPSCDTCNDHSGWSEDGGVLREIYERANPQRTCRDITLTYRGQFVVSARRMRRANRDLLTDLRARVAVDEHLGYTMERSWGTIFQCPTISERCPTLLSGWLGNRAAVEDCQCLDEID